MVDTICRKLSQVILLVLSSVAWAADGTATTEVLEAPLEDVWPALSEPKYGDLDTMIERGEIRVLTSFTLGSYYIDRGRQRGIVYESSRRLEAYTREQVGTQARHLKVTIIPVRRDQILPFLIAGHGDVAFEVLPEVNRS